MSESLNYHFYLIRDIQAKDFPNFQKNFEIVGWMLTKGQLDHLVDLAYQIRLDLNFFVFVVKCGNQIPEAILDNLTDGFEFELELHELLMLHSEEASKMSPPAFQILMGINVEPHRNRRDTIIKVANSLIYNYSKYNCLSFLESLFEQARYYIPISRANEIIYDEVYINLRFELYKLKMFLCWNLHPDYLISDLTNKVVSCFVETI